MKNMTIFFREIDLFDFTSFFAYTFLNFLARCVLGRIKNIILQLTGPSPK